MVCGQPSPHAVHPLLEISVLHEIIIFILVLRAEKPELRKAKRLVPDHELKQSRNFLTPGPERYLVPQAVLCNSVKVIPECNALGVHGVLGVRLRFVKEPAAA